jgi:two-component system response regulator NreC
MTKRKRETPLKENRITVAILEDNATLVKGMKAELDKPDIFVAVASDNIDQFLEELKSCQPKVAIVDLRIWKELDAGFVAITKARAVSPDTQFVIYTFYDVIEKFHKGINLGIKAFVSKNIYEKPLDEVVRIVFNGGTYYGDMLPKYLDKVKESTARLTFANDDEASNGSELSKKELEVLDLLDNGLTNSDIAAKLFVTVNTVKAHTKNIRAKLGVKSTTEAIRIHRLRKKDQPSF